MLLLYRTDPSDTPHDGDFVIAAPTARPASLEDRRRRAEGPHKAGQERHRSQKDRTRSEGETTISFSHREEITRDLTEI